MRSRSAFCSLALTVSMVAVGAAAPSADCGWELKGVMQDQTGQPIRNKVFQVWTQLGTGNASDPEVTGPKETNWAAGQTDGSGNFVIRTSVPFPAATCTKSRVFGGTIGKNTLDLGLYGPFEGPKAQGGVHQVDVGRIGPGASADDIK